MRAILGITLFIAGGAYASEATLPSIAFSLQNPQLVISVSKASTQLSQMLIEAKCKDNTDNKAEPGFCEVLTILKNSVETKEFAKILPKIYDGAAAYAVAGADDSVFQTYIRSVQSQNPELSEREVVDQTSDVLSVITDSAYVQKAK